MTAFQQTENLRQADFKKTSGYFSPDARADGQLFTSIGSPRGALMWPWLLPLACAEENLFEGIRSDTLSYFREKAISWHGKLPGERPSNHLRDSQICCVNCLAPFAHNPKALAELFVPLFPSLRRLLPMEDDRFRGI
jgi:hypothetical protein